MIGFSCRPRQNARQSELRFVSRAKIQDESFGKQQIWWLLVEPLAEIKAIEGEGQEASMSEHNDRVSCYFLLSLMEYSWFHSLTISIPVLLLTKEAQNRKA
ncbi:hypothetical protein ACFOSD_08255 [Salinispirillum marinum]|uniref:Uncharacterized protein n=2 Tax=Saccharospirillaceae TaxID=255527 RepID=A0ABV8BD94_9GAMM